MDSRPSRVRSGFGPALLALAFLVLAFGSLGCRSAKPPSDADLGSLAEIRATLRLLYGAFSFDPGEEASWEVMDILFLEGASFVAPVRPGTPPVAVDATTFKRDFADWIATSPRGASGFHERIERAHIDFFGHIAHAYVLFEGFVPPDGEAETRGIDSIQLIRCHEGWRVASFTTQYAREGVPIPTRFE